LGLEKGKFSRIIFKTEIELIPAKIHGPVQSGQPGTQADVCLLRLIY